MGEMHYLKCKTFKLRTSNWATFTFTIRDYQDLSSTCMPTWRHCYLKSWNGKQNVISI